MMNAARFGVGVQGIGLAELAYQQAVAYARERVQSRDVGGSEGAVPIIRHPDVRRMLMGMRAQVEAARALATFGAGLSDRAHRHADADQRTRSLVLYEYLVPIIKGWSTEMAETVTREAVQVHGGMGFIEETGVAQHYRDAKILPIYEGTTAIQANDLVGRKTMRDGGGAARELLQRVRAMAGELAGMGPEAAAIGTRLSEAAAALDQVVSHVLAQARSNPRAVYAGSVPYLKLAGTVAGGWALAQLAVAALQQLEAGEGDGAFLRAKVATARFFAEHFLPQAQAMCSAIVHGGEAVLALDEASF
jgi:hypothetical protein